MAGGHGQQFAGKLELPHAAEQPRGGLTFR
jgi:hypothetical protein